MINLLKLKKWKLPPLKKLLYVSVLIILYIKQFLFSSNANDFLKTFTEHFAKLFKSVLRIYKLLFCREKNFQSDPKLQRKRIGRIETLSEDFVNVLYILWVPLTFLLCVTELLNQMFFSRRGRTTCSVFIDDNKVLTTFNNLIYECDKLFVCKEYSILAIKSDVRSFKLSGF